LSATAEPPAFDTCARRRIAGHLIMEKKMKPAAVYIAAATLAGPVFAGGPIAVAPEPVPVIVEPAPILPPSRDWSGLYAGGQLGYGDLDSNGGGLDGNGFLGGVHAGYRWDFGQFVLGTELDYDTADIDLGRAAGSLDEVARVKLTGGADLGDVLLYATTGAAYGSASVGRASLSDDGWFYGAGMAYAIGERWTIGAELLQHNFDNFDGSGVDIDALTATARLGYRF
jgi:outer membrane immunogenic protein